MYTILPLSSAVRQVFTLDLAPDGIAGLYPVCASGGT